MAAFTAQHAEICSANRYVNEAGEHVYGWAYCTCGADIAGYPLYETEEGDRCL